MFYHVTHSSRVPSILEKGLDPERKNPFTINLNATLERYLRNDPIIVARKKGVFLYSKRPEDLRNLSDKDYRILEVNIDATENTFCAESKHIDPIVKGVIHLMRGFKYDKSNNNIFLSDNEMRDLITKYQKSWSVWSPTAEKEFNNPEVIHVAKILPSHIKVLNN
ncbi:hypothetical protein [Priestia aryabhattai]|uniref:hypothetical protein n=1 Tax=Priestia aryabhattai TaxID=412384 RepID=UPI003D2AC56A